MELVQRCRNTGVWRSDQLSETLDIGVNPLLNITLPIITQRLPQPPAATVVYTVSPSKAEGCLYRPLGIVFPVPCLFLNPLNIPPSLFLALATLIALTYRTEANLS